MKSVINKYFCRLCFSSNLTRVIKLSETPTANSFLTIKEIEKNQETFPLEVNFCQNCYHLQLSNVVNPNLLFKNYLYVSGTSKVFVDHFENYVKDVEKSYCQRGTVVDIGSNDGTLLKSFKKSGWKVVGVEPAFNLAKLTNKNKIKTFNSFFSLEVAKKIKEEFGTVHIITANNVFAHIDDLKSILSNIKILMNDDSVFVFEVSYLIDVLEKTLFDTIYHEHLSYHSVKPLDKFFKKNQMRLVDVLKVNTHGGSIRGYVTKSTSKIKLKNNVKKIIQYEEINGYFNKSTYINFEKRVNNLKQSLLKIIDNELMNGKKIVGFGAPAKATTLMHHFGLNRDIINYIVDDNALKQGRYTPGLKVPIVDSTKLINDKEKKVCIILFAWNFSDAIVSKFKYLLQPGTKFLIPLPCVREVEISE